MKTIYGVSTNVPSNKKLKNGYTLYDLIMRQKCFPSFWGRTLIGENAITSEEIEFLHAKDCKIAFIIRDLTEAQVSGMDGSAVALRATEAIKDLGVPENSGIVIFAEIKPEWSVNYLWMISFAQTIFENGYRPGFIGNTDSSKNFCFDRHCSRFVYYTNSENQFGAIYCATEPKLNDIPEDWSPYCPTELESDQIDFWNCETVFYGDIEVSDVYARNESVLKFLW